MNQSEAADIPVRALDGDPLAEAVLQIADPLLAVLPSLPEQEVLTEVLSFAVDVWNAHALATSAWQEPGQLAGMERAALAPGSLPLLRGMYSAVAKRVRALHARDPRVVAAWAVRRAPDGSYTLECEARVRVLARASSHPPPATEDERHRSSLPPMG